MSAEWLYLQFYPDDLAAMDALLRDVVAPAVAAARRAAPIERWFFLRYLDEEGPHVRLRLRGGADALGAAHAAIDDTLAVADPCPWVRLDLYEPELAKYGGAPGVAIAEAVFEVSSELALAALTGTADEGARRALARELMQRAVHAHLPPAAQRPFWHAYARYWRAGAEDGSGLTRGVDEPARPPAWPPAVQAAIGRYDVALAAARSRAGEAGVAIGDERVCFHHVHLTNNRLGVYPLEESLLATELLATAPSI